MHRASIRLQSIPAQRLQYSRLYSARSTEAVGKDSRIKTQCELFCASLQERDIPYEFETRNGLQEDRDSSHCSSLNKDGKSLIFYPCAWARCKTTPTVGVQRDTMFCSVLKIVGTDRCYFRERGAVLAITPIKLHISIPRCSENDRIHIVALNKTGIQVKTGKSPRPTANIWFISV